MILGAAQIYVMAEGRNFAFWHFSDLAPKAATGVEPDIRNFAQMAGLSALLPSVESAANDCFEPLVTNAAVRIFWRYGRKAVVRCKCERSAQLFSKRTFGAVRQRCEEAWPLWAGRGPSLHDGRRAAQRTNLTLAKSIQSTFQALTRPLSDFGVAAQRHKKLPFSTGAAGP
jgi:hypothetical protein